MTYRGTAYVLASAIYAGTRDAATVPVDLVAERAYVAIDDTIFRTDAAKADLYARLAERLTADTTFATAVDVIECAMEQTALACSENLACL